MEHEPIYLDGVDVSECEFHQIDANELYPKAHYCGSMKNIFCENDPNCYFKQLARKTQECEELKAQLNDMACMDDDNVLCYPRQELKKEYNEYISTHKYSNEEFQQERETVADLAFWSNKYKRGLEKIEKELKEDLYCESQECGCDDFEECLRCTKEHILDIINKAKGK